MCVCVQVQKHACVGMCWAVLVLIFKAQWLRGEDDTRWLTIEADRKNVGEGRREKRIWHLEHWSMEEHSDLPRLGHYLNSTQLSDNVVESLLQVSQVQSGVMWPSLDSLNGANAADL